MMGQDKVGEIARICDIILKYSISQGVIKGAYNFILEAVRTMNSIFNENVDVSLDEFKTKAKTTFPQIKEL
jgi:hypothetical protein